MVFCDAASSIDFRDACVRSTWSALVPSILVLGLCATSLPYPRPLRKTFAAAKFPFQLFISLAEAEGQRDEDATSRDENTLHSDGGRKGSAWRAVVFSFIGLVESLAWVGVGSYRIIDESSTLWVGLSAILIAFTWLYATVRSIFSLEATPPYDIFSVYFLHLFGALLQLGGAAYDYNVLGYPWPSAITSLAMVLNLVLITLGLVVMLGMPVGVPSEQVKEGEIGTTLSPEDYTTLWGWISFSWVYPLIKKGRDDTLNEDDVWGLSATMQSRVIFAKYNSLLSSTLLRRLLTANSLDLILDFSLTIASVIFTYAGPFFLKNILDIMQHPPDEQTREKRSLAYIYAFLAFATTLLKAQCDLQHLWFGRRACTRMRSELMAAIYEKALKRRDFSGIIDKDKAAGADSKKTDKKKDDNDDPKAGADVGKIVNLMAGDATRVAEFTAMTTMVYGAPFEIIIASTFLYQLLGWSAFAGFSVLIASWPLNSYVMRRAIRINKGNLVAKDKRMAVLNELIGAIKFIKFFAWEERWIERAMEARAVELKWMIKSRINSVMFFLVWICAPIFVSITSFFVFVMQGGELTVSKAFTAIALFSMIRAPLNIIPTWIVQALQAKIGLDRIDTFLKEDEVTEQVSSLKRDLFEPRLSGDEEGLGLDNATLKWNAVEEKEEDKDKKDVKQSNGKPSSPASSTDDTATVGAGQSDAASTTASVLSTEDHHFELRDISVKFPEGQLTLVTGPTASGKTALLLALLGEMTLLKGRIILSKDASKVDDYGFMHALSYAAQTPWLRHQSIKDNILFGYPLDEERYQQVLESCALKPDLAVLEDGDATEIGAKGVSLSGGQKARVALARAVYARTKYVLLDDPLSAVDSHTARMLFEKLLQGPLLAKRTVILVTHHVELVLPGADYLVRMLDGRIDTQGTIKDLKAQGILEDIAHDAAVEVQQEEQAVAVAEASDPEAVAIKGDEAAVPAATAKKPRKLVEDERREEGGVRWSVYKSYLKASSYWIWVCMLLLLVLSQFLSVGEKVWIKVWGEAYESLPLHYLPFRYFSSADHELLSDGYVPLHGHFQSSHRVDVWRITREWPRALEYPLYYIGVYAAIGLASGLTTVLAVVVQYTGALRASRIIFEQLLGTVVRATFRFHDTTPQGRMLNRFGKDVETIDRSLASSLQNVNSSLASLLASVLTVAFVFPPFFAPAALIGYVYWRLAVAYLNTGRDLKRMESNSRSPIFSDFGEVLEGIVTVRAFSAEKRFLNNLHRKVDLTTKMWYTIWMTNRWLLLNFDCLGATMVLVTTLFALSRIENGAGIGGLVITSSMNFTMGVYWFCRMYTMLELDLNSVERVIEYLDLPQEPPAVIKSNRPPAYWPSSSSSNRDSLVQVEDLVVKYSPELPPVLHGVSFHLKAKERIGLLGRTGSGKSTLAMSLLRFVDPASGKIIIDGIDISKIGIHDLRSRITFIPQDAALFSGTLRENLDPFNEHEDLELIDVLFRVQLLNQSSYASQRASREASRAPSIHEVEREETAPSISTAITETDVKTKISLETQVSAGGTNFSQGQRQLIAMARALLRKSSIIILDEATSSIDFATDAKIQATIREEFGDSLLLTIAHRLRTVIDYDRLLVLDQGKIVEFDTPYNLIRQSNGIFRNMCLKSGSFGELEAAAKEKAAIYQT
ncbi:hypothetical protein HGRIS_008350 [Hohenbuehelia grisea]|uniref:Multidrug resistance-associated ABC transporter n=1 Tax=Hohenbuehelia grisea TaxID=104357 RepID=A0ABR3J8Q2_9AGAR